MEIILSPECGSLLQVAWVRSLFHSTRKMDNQVSNLRGSLGPQFEPFHQRRIDGSSGSGYQPEFGACFDGRPREPVLNGCFAT